MKQLLLCLTFQKIIGTTTTKTLFLVHTIMLGEKVSAFEVVVSTLLHELAGDHLSNVIVGYPYMNVLNHQGSRLHALTVGERISYWLEATYSYCADTDGC